MAQRAESGCHGQHDERWGQTGKELVVFAVRLLVFFYFWKYVYVLFAQNNLRNDASIIIIN